MTSLEEYRKRMEELYALKGWNRDWRWLVTGYFAESGELVQDILKGEKPEVIAEEFADVMHYLMQLMNEKVPGVDLDKALVSKIESNKVHKKKTTDKEGNTVLA